MLRHFFAIGYRAVENLLRHARCTIFIQNLCMELVHLVLREDECTAHEDRGFNGGQAQAVLFTWFRIRHWVKSVNLPSQALKVRVTLNCCLIGSYTRISVYTTCYRR